MVKHSDGEVSSKMMSAMETQNILCKGVIYANFDAKIPALVWVLADRDRSKMALEIMQYGDDKQLVWALIEASVISMSGVGIGISTWQGTQSWHPFGNARLPR